MPARIATGRRRGYCIGWDGNVGTPGAGRTGIRGGVLAAARRAQATVLSSGHLPSGSDTEWGRSGRSSERNRRRECQETAP